MVVYATHTFPVLMLEHSVAVSLSRSWACVGRETYGHRALSSSWDPEHKTAKILLHQLDT